MARWVEPDTHGWVHHPTGAADWAQLLARYGAHPRSPLARVFEVARANRCRSVIEENRYVDADYRSEFSSFWSLQFDTRPAFARRLHFFRRVVRDDDVHRIDPRNSGYLGYSTLKPISSGRVGRTLLAPPPRLANATLALATDRVSLFGAELEVTGAPFLEQDGEYLRCAHAAIWMCHYSAVLRGLVGRELTASLVQHSPTVLDYERSLPSKGLSVNQIQAVFAATGQPALFYGLSRMPSVQGVPDPIPRMSPDKKSVLPAGVWDTRIFSVLCRYLNSGFPVLVGTRNHAFVIVGWFQDGRRIRFVACDDQWGPYETIVSPFTDRRAPWVSLMVPLPPKVFLSGEQAEGSAHMLLSAQAVAPNVPPIWQDMGHRLQAGEISLRTSLRSNVDYKRIVSRQGRGEPAVRLLRLARLPHWVWVVEALRRDLRSAGRPSVVAEVVLDSTAGDTSQRLDALSLPGVVITDPPDGGTRAAVVGPPIPWMSLREAA